MDNIYDTFYETFGINKLEVREPGRTVDNDGEICEWYIDYQYPSIEPVFFDLLNIYEVQYNGPAFVINITEHNLKQCLIKKILELYNNLEQNIKKEFKQDIKDTFVEYYGGY